jgi:hypothetical protein
VISESAIDAKDRAELRCKGVLGHTYCVLYTYGAERTCALETMKLENARRVAEVQTQARIYRQSRRGAKRVWRRVK